VFLRLAPSAPRPCPNSPSYRQAAGLDVCTQTPMGTTNTAANLLEVDRLEVRFPVKQRFLGRVKAHVKAVDKVSFALQTGETLGLVGESGCGKTTLGRAIVRLNTPSAGRILFEGEDLVQLSGPKLRARRRGLQMIFQDPYASLNPRMTIAQTISEAIDIHKLARNGADRRSRIHDLLQSVGLDPSYSGRYPHQFSGGQRQ